jgi:uncharacterized membrane protein
MFKRYLMAGLLIWVPLVITLWVLNTVVNAMDQFLPAQATSETLFGRHIPGFGLIVVIAVVLVTGVAAANFFGKKLVGFWEGLLSRIPLVRSIYSSVKQVSDTILSPNGQAFRKALLVQYPRAGVWTIAFQTGNPNEHLRAITGQDLVSVYVPTTPNPTSGFFLLMKASEVVELTMSVDEALKYVVSMGVVAPSASAFIESTLTPKS